MNTQNCVCFPCIGELSSVPTIAVTSEQPLAAIIPWNIWESIFKKLEPQNLLAASAVCKRWRFAAAKDFINKSDDRLKSTPCYKEFCRSRHIIMFDVSSSMKTTPAIIPRAHQIYEKITRLLDATIKNGGIYICKFAAEHSLKYFRTLDKATEFLTAETPLRDGSILSDAVTTIFDKAISRNKAKATHVHIISDMNVQLDSSIFSVEKLSALKGRITFHYYSADGRDKDNFLKKTEEEFLKLRETTLPQAEKKYGDQLSLKFYRS